MLTEPQRKKLDELNTKKMKSLQKSGPKLTPEEEMWMTRAIDAQSRPNGKLEEEAATEIAAVTMQQAVREDIETPPPAEQEEEISEEEAQKVLDELNQSVREDLVKLGLLDEAKAAIQEHGEIFFQSLGGKVFGFRPLYFTDMQLMKAENDDDRLAQLISERCVVVNKGILKHPKLYTHKTIAQLVASASDSAPDYPFSVKMKDL